MEQYFYIIRHGETDYNKMGMVQGSGINSELNATGWQQASAFYEKYKDIPFDRIYVSALQRTSQSVMGFTDLGVPTEVVEELNEISWGDFEGLHITEEMHERYLNIIGEWQKGNLDIAYRNAETPLQMQARQKIAREKILNNKSDKKILVATHGRYLRAFICLLINHPLHQMDDFTHSNLCLYILKYDGEKFTLVDQDNTLHLDGIRMS
jgi:broad specificity phosphatase PhoE